MMDINNHRLLSIVSGGDSEEFDNYIATTTDPGNTLLIIAAFICLVSLVGLPLYVKFGLCLSRCNKNRHRDTTDTTTNANGINHIVPTSIEASHINHVYMDGQQRPQYIPPPTTQQQTNDTTITEEEDFSFIQKCQKVLSSTVKFILNTRKRGAHTADNVDARREAISRGIAREGRESMIRNLGYAQQQQQQQHPDKQQQELSTAPTISFQTQNSMIDDNNLEEGNMEIVLTDSDEQKKKNINDDDNNISIQKIYEQECKSFDEASKLYQVDDNKKEDEEEGDRKENWSSFHRSYSYSSSHSSHHVDDRKEGETEVIMDPFMSSSSFGHSGDDILRDLGEDTLHQSNVHTNEKKILPPPPPHIEPTTYKCCSTSHLKQRANLLWKIIKYDNETKRLLHLAVPFTCSAIAETVASLIILAIISQNLGTDNMVAFAMTDVIVGISSSFMGGWIEAISSLGSMAYGAGNYELCGSYAQCAIIGYAVCEIPMFFTWRFLIGPILRLMGFDDAVIIIAQDYVWVTVAVNMVMGLNEGILDLLEVVEHERYANIMYCLTYAVEVGCVALVAVKTDANLVILGLVMLVIQALFFFFNLVIPNKMGWFARFEEGLFGKFSCSNLPVVKELFGVAFPLAIGSLLAYAEWEVLTVFAAVLGPAEAATWAVLGFIWDVFESTIEAIGDAGEVRVSYQLGKGRPALARLSSYKSMFLASTLALIVTSAFLAMSNVLPTWLTSDETIQDMLTELFPLVALGNITMNIGMVCWALIGAQGRYRLATSIATACSLLITLPIGAVTTVSMRINLQGLTFAVVVGYTITAMLLSTFLFMSDWDMFSKQIQERMEEKEESDSDDDSSSSSSNSNEPGVELTSMSAPPPSSKDKHVNNSSSLESAFITAIHSTKQQQQMKQGNSTAIKPPDSPTRSISPPTRRPRVASSPPRQRRSIKSFRTQEECAQYLRTEASLCWRDKVGTQRDHSGIIFFDTSKPMTTPTPLHDNERVIRNVDSEDSQEPPRLLIKGRRKRFH